MLTRRQWLRTTAAPALAAQKGPPNILFIISDDHHFQCLGAAGNPHIQTPNIDRLASRGVHFTNGIISTSQCAPSRGILLSGLESYQTGLESNDRTGFREGAGPTIVEQMRGAGYQTALVGKWHITPKPEACGFTKAPIWLESAASPYRDPTLRRGIGGQPEKVPGHMTDIFTENAIQYLRGAKQPFLLWLAYTAPHTPWSEDDRYKKPYAGRNGQLAPPAHPKGGGRFDWETYYAVITHLDEAAGRVIAETEKAGLWENTLIVFLGDNGYLCGAKGFQGKVEAWDESIRVPYLACGGVVRARGKLDAPVASVDLPATFLDYAAVKPARKLAGRSLRPEFETGRSRREVAFSAWNDGRPEALLVPRAVEPYRVARTRAYKYILWESRKQALFDLRTDPGEEQNLVASAGHTKMLKTMRDLMAARMRQTADPAQAWFS
ncbi:MAG: sulfatase-like hydrolase/transferase [Acidobacteria bacterium]|nr:sulfatase-like hydrolase/transferase [Acidobacteriota bacterium]